MSPAPRRAPPLLAPNAAIEVLRVLDYAVSLVGEPGALAFVRGWLIAAKERT